MVKRKKPLKPKRWLFPSSQEREYIRNLQALTKTLDALIESYLMPKLPYLIEQANRTAPIEPRADSMPIRGDGFLEDLFVNLNDIRQMIRPKQIETDKKAMETAQSINRFNKIQFEKLATSLFSIDLFFDEPWLRDQMNLFATQNVELISSLIDDELERVSGIVQRGFQQGLPYKVVAKEIEQTFGISSRKAKLIGRDQTVKLNASLTKLRQEELGISTYTWQTSGDERVRASHRIMDGLIGRWDDPTVYKKPGDKKWKKRTSVMSQLHPGGDVQCRCVSLPNVDDLA